MHIHAPSMDVAATALSAAATEKTAATQRAAEVRRKLRSSALSLKQEDDDSLVVSPWTDRDARHSRSPYDVNPRNPKSPAKSDLPVIPFSLWA